MANTVSNTTLLDGSKRRIIAVQITGDGTGEETNLIVYDYSADTTKPDNVASLSARVLASGTDAVSVGLTWDATTDQPVWHQGNNTVSGQNDVSFFGGVRNKSSGATGDLLLSTVGLGATERLLVIIEIRKC